jgi:hypothetical protein
MSHRLVIISALIEFGVPALLIAWQLAVLKLPWDIRKAVRR